MVDVGTRVEQVTLCDVVLVCIDPHGTIVGWSVGAEHLFGHDAAWMIGRSFKAHLPDPITEEHRARLRRVVESMRPEQDVTTVLGSDGTAVTVDVIVVPVQSSDGAVDRVDLVMTPSDPTADPAVRVRDLADRFGLNDRESDVIRLLSNGHRTSTIARELCLAPGTVRNTLSCIYAKVGVGSQVELIEQIIGGATTPYPTAVAARMR